MSNLVDAAKIFALLVHKGQLDDCGESYYRNHLEVVGDSIQAFTADDNVIAAAYLHDTLEDTKVTFDDLVESFNIEVANLVNEVTHEGKKDDYGYYFPRLKTRDGILIKLVDRLSNISRMETWDDKRKRQYLAKTKFWKDGSDRQIIQRGK